MAKDITDVMLGWIFDLFGWIINKWLEVMHTRGRCSLNIPVFVSSQWR